MKAASLGPLTCLCLILFCASGFMLPEDKLQKEYWRELTPKEKRIFLMGYRVATGPSQKVSEMPEVPPGFLVLSAHHFDQLINLVDTFYEDAKNKRVRVGGAIEIAIMRMQKKSEEEITKKIELERRMVIEAF